MAAGSEYGAAALGGAGILGMILTYGFNYIRSIRGGQQQDFAASQMRDLVNELRQEIRDEREQKTRALQRINNLVTENAEHRERYAMLQAQVTILTSEVDRLRRTLIEEREEHIDLYDYQTRLIEWLAYNHTTDTAKTPLEFYVGAPPRALRRLRAKVDSDLSESPIHHTDLKGQLNEAD